MNEATLQRLARGDRDAWPEWTRTVRAAQRFLGHDPDHPAPDFDSPATRWLVNQLADLAMRVLEVWQPSLLGQDTSRWGELWIDQVYGDEFLRRHGRPSLYPPPEPSPDGGPSTWPGDTAPAAQGQLYFSVERPTPDTLPDEWISAARTRDRRLRDETGGRGARPHHTDPGAMQRYLLTGLVATFSKRAIAPWLDEIAYQRGWLEKQRGGRHALRRAANRAKVPDQWGGHPLDRRAERYRKLAAQHGADHAYHQVLYEAWTAEPVEGESETGAGRRLG